MAEQARLVKMCQSSVWVAKLILDQTVGCSTREGVYFWVNWRYCDRYRLGHRPVLLTQLRGLNVQSGLHKFGKERVSTEPSLVVGVEVEVP